MNTIINAYWERVNLILTPKEAINKDVYLLDGKRKKSPLPVRDGKIIINITNLSNGKMIEDGKYTLYADGSKLQLSSALLTNIKYLTRVFKYRKAYSLVIEPKIEENDESFFIQADYYVKNRNYKHNFNFAQARSVKGIFGVILKSMFLFSLNLFYRIVGLFKFSKEKRILFYSQNLEEPEGNLKSLYEYFTEKHIKNTSGYFYNKFKNNSVSCFIKSVVKLALSDVIVIDNYVPLFSILNLRKNQRVVQLWHAGVGFKSVGYARFGEDGSPHPFISAHRKYTDVIVDEERTVDIYKEVFGLEESVFKPLGMPRLDGYLTEEKIKETTSKLYEKNPELETKKVILFSPTYRGFGASVAHYDYSVLNLKRIHEFCLDNGFIFIVKMHPFIREPISIPDEYKETIFDYSSYDINELIYVSDIMITDYSSCAYEFSFFNRPLIFFRYDKDFYEYTRPVHTLDTFTHNQYEVQNFEQLEAVLTNLKDIDINGRFANMREREKDCCEKIAAMILNDEA